MGSTTGVGALTYNSSICNTGDWAPWALSVSGNGFYAESAAAGTLRALSHSGILPNVASIASVSGGSWFNAQFAFSKAYYDGVVSYTTPIDTWWTSYQSSATGGMMSLYETIPTWEAMIMGMFRAYTPGLDTVLATQANRAGSTSTDLVFCTTFVGNSLMSDNSSMVQLSSGGSNAYYSNPAYWAVPTTGTAGWTIPSLPEPKWTSGSSSTTDQSIALVTPRVSKIGAMSSAANGITANPALIAQYVPNGLSFESQFSTAGQLPGNGVCTSESYGSDCAYPANMCMDGCYSDNLGFALHVGYLQKKFPGKKLRLMATSSELCNRVEDPTCTTAVTESSFRSLFSGSPYPTVEGWLPAIVPGPDRTIFAESVTDVQAFGAQTGIGGSSFVTGTFTTIANNYFGVAAGTQVSILVLNVNGVESTVAPASANSKIAANSQTSWKTLFETIETTSKLDSTSPYIYGGLY